jgi:iron complex outermembrane receptor protein
MRSGVFEGDVDSYAVVDASGVYDIPHGGLLLTVSIDNLLNNEYRSFVGAPRIGRMTHAQLGLTF